MNKKEALEIRRQFSAQNCTITRICGCYINGEKEKRLAFKEAFLSLSEEEGFKYFELFKKTLSGTIGKNLINMSFPLEQELKGGAQEFLLRLRESGLADEELLDEFYDKVVESYDFSGHYLILLIHAVYDVPAKASDDSILFDASDTVYDYILCSICPVSLSKAALCYNTEKNSIEERIRDWVVDAPSDGFLFPAFNERTSDIHSILYYTKKPEALKEAFIKRTLGCAEVMSAGEQKKSFQTVLSNALEEECSYEIVKSIHENLNEMLEQTEEDPRSLELGKREITHILMDSGVSFEKLESFEREYDEAIGEKSSLLASNLTDARKFSVKTADAVIRIPPERAEMIELKIINGRKCLIIPVDGDLEVDGVPVSMQGVVPVL